MAVERPLDELSSQDLFASATAPEPQPQAPAESSAEPPEPSVQEPETPPQEPASPEPQQPELPLQDPPGGIPSWRLREEAEARRAAEQRAQQLEQRYNQVMAHIQQSQKKPDFFENPEQSTMNIMAQALRPILEEQQRAAMYNSRLIANSVHTAEAVNKAEEAFMQARDAGSLDPVDYERVVQSPNRYDAAVQWHKRQSLHSTVGDDPEAWFQKRLEREMADPKFQASLLEKVRGSVASTPGTVRLPPSLSRVPSAQGNGPENLDGSDRSLWAFATKR